MSLGREESFVEKRLKKDGFTVTRIKETQEYKTPDFLVQKGKFKALVEVKIGFKHGKILQTIPETGAHQFDPSFAVEEYFAEAALQYREYRQNNLSVKGLPFVLVFIQPFFIDNELEWSDGPYQHFTEISLVLIPKQTHPLDSMANEMSMEELEEIINSEKIPFSSQTHWSWSAIKNPFAINSIDTRNLPSVTKIIRPIKSLNMK